MGEYTTLKTSILDGEVGLLTLSRPERGNAQTVSTWLTAHPHHPRHRPPPSLSPLPLPPPSPSQMTMWQELPAALNALQAAGARAIVLSGAGRHFCTGIDLSVLGGEALQAEDAACQGRSRLRFISYVKILQQAMTACETAAVPVLAAVHGACFGAGVDLVTACDIRYTTSDARFCVKEADLGLAADMGTLARLPGIVGDGVARDLALTAREMSGEEALRVGLATRVFKSREELLEAAVAVARSLAAKSPLALAGTKRMLMYQRGRTVEEGLDAVAVWNAAVLPGSADISEVFAAKVEGRAPRFSKL
jgi:enoyl-CoA hydratase/carnithine racemase